MRAVKDGLPTPSGEVKNRNGLARQPQSRSSSAFAWLGIELEKSVQLACLQRCTVDGWVGAG
jgi:hypothetical protein